MVQGLGVPTTLAEDLSSFPGLMSNSSQPPRDPKLYSGLHRHYTHVRISQHKYAYIHIIKNSKSLLGILSPHYGVIPFQLGFS